MKTYYIASTHRNRTTIWEGTMEYLVNRVFGYDLECGHSHDYKIPLHPKTGKGLVNALNNSACECNRYHDFYELVPSKEEAERIVNCDTEYYSFHPMHD